VPRPKQRTPELRDRVLQAAVATLAGEGIAGFTTRKVAEGAVTSVPAVYELFGDRAGLVREMFFEGFRRLRARLEETGETGDARADLLALVGAIRDFVSRNEPLARVMFSRPFSDFDPGRDEIEAGSAVRTFVVGRVQRCVDSGVVAADATDVAHVLLALVEGLASQESAGWLGTSAASVERRWSLAFEALLDGLAPAPERSVAGSKERKQQAARRSRDQGSSS
jgi:AcrR family transcriptional regulator